MGLLDTQAGEVYQETVLDLLITLSEWGRCHFTVRPRVHLVWGPEILCLKHCWSIWICRGHCSRITKILLICGDIILCITSFVHDIISLWQICVDVNSAVRFEMHVHWSLQAMMIPRHGICISAAQHFNLSLRFVGLLIFTSVKIIDQCINSMAKSLLKL